MNARRLILIPILVIFAGACGSRGPVGTGEIAPTEPLTSLERFLGAVDDRDLEAMGFLFGTRHGPVADTGSSLGCGFKRFGSWLGMGDRCQDWTDVELQMDLIATILEHQSYEVVESRPVAGRQARTTRFSVDLVRETDTVASVPFDIVQGKGGRWFVEVIDLERVTRR